MQFLTNSQSAEWCKRRCWRGDEAADVAFERPRKSASGEAIWSPSVENRQAGQHLHLARAARGWLCNDFSPEVLVWVRETGVWSGNENLHLYYAWRRGLGDLRLIEEAPGHHALPFEMEECITVMHMAMCFGWGFTAAAHGAVRTVNHDHDGVFWMSSPSPDDAKSITDFYTRFGLSPEQRSQKP